MLKKEDIEKASLVKAIIEKDYDKSFKIADLAETVASNKKILNAAFKHITGKSPIMYQRVIRIEKAKQLLVDTDHTIKVIARKVGLDRRNLEKQFKKLTNTTPREWRIENKTGIIN